MSSSAAALGLADDRPAALPPAPPTLMTRHPIPCFAQYANQNRHKPRPKSTVSCKFDYFRAGDWPNRLNLLPVLHGRLMRPLSAGCALQRGATARTPTQYFRGQAGGSGS